jgi:hypothetical protein
MDLVRWSCAKSRSAAIRRGSINRNGRDGSATGMEVIVSRVHKLLLVRILPAALLVAASAAGASHDSRQLSGTAFTSYATGPSPISVVAADLNADGKLDLVTANFGAGGVSVLLGTATVRSDQHRPFLRPLAILTALRSVI